MFLGYATTAERALKGKSGTGRKRSKRELQRNLGQYREKWEKEILVNMNKEDFFELSDIATYLRTELAIDVAYQIGYLYGKGILNPDINVIAITKTVSDK